MPSLSLSLFLNLTISTMDSQNLKQRATGDSAARSDVDVDDKKRRRDKKGILTKRGITSLTAALSVPLALTVIAIFLASSNTYTKTTPSKTPFWFPAPWALHAATAASAAVMGLAAWLVWAKGGFHASPTALYLYLAQFVLGLVWDPVVFGSGSSWVGLVLCAGMFGSLVGCLKAFKELNPLAAQLVKPCLAWTAFLGLVNLTLVYL